MAISSVIEALLEGIFFRYAEKGWNLLKGAGPAIISSDIGKTMIDKVISGKGLGDSKGFGRALKRSGISLAEQQRIEMATIRLESINRKYAENFRRIVAFAGDSDDPNTVDGGVEIIQNLAQRPNDQELDIAILALGVVTEAPEGTIDEIKLWAMRKALPYFNSIIQRSAHTVGDAVYSVSHYIRDQDDAEALRRRQMRNPLRWLLPWNWVRWFIDSF